MISEASLQSEPTIRSEPRGKALVHLNRLLQPERVRRVRRARVRIYALPLLIAILGLDAPRSWADGCSDCPAPSAESIISAAGVALETRTGLFGEQVTDELYTDQGECTASGEEVPEIDLKESYLVLSAAGEVWNCPQSQSSSQVTAEIAREHKTDWSLSASVELSLKTPVAEYKARFSASHGGSDGIREVTRLATTLQAKNCERVPWLAYLRVGTFELRAEFAVTQRWAWWTKNTLTGSTVHASGDYMQACGSTEITFDRKAPLAWHLRLAHRNCCGGSGRYRDLGFHPPLPKGLKRPDWPEEFGYPEPPLPQEGTEPQDGTGPAPDGPADDDPLAPPHDPLAPPHDPLAPPPDALPQEPSPQEHGAAGDD